MRPTWIKQEYPATTLMFVGIFISFFVVALIFLKSNHEVSAANKDDWKSTNIIDDGSFTDANSMSVEDIQGFLNSKIGTCDIWGTGKAVEYNYNGTRAAYAASQGWAGPPYTCLNKYYEVPKTAPGGDLPANNYSSPDNIPAGAKSAAWIIKYAAVRYNISPKVLLVKIATESAGPLTADNWPLFSQYRYAMGSHCPDSGPGGSANCDTNYAGFSIQIYTAAELMRSYLDGMDQSWWPYKRPGGGVDRAISSGTKDVCSNRYGTQNSNCVGWNVVQRGCGGTVLNIENKATAALYTYTPYQPNAAALNNMYSTGDNCSAYGNRNFWRVFVDWFGLPSVKAYRWEEVSKTLYTDETKGTTVDRANVKQGQYLYVQYKVKNTGSAYWYRDAVRLGASNNAASAFYTPEWISPNRAATLVENEVKPGETGTIEFWIRTPNSSGTYKEYFNLLVENVSWFVDIGSFWEMNVSGSSSRASLSPTTRMLKRGDSLISPDSRSVLSLTPFGSLLLYKDYRVIWSAPSNAIYKLILQEDGNLVAYTAAGSPVWVQNGSSNSFLLLTNNELIFNTGATVIWSQSTQTADTKSPDHLATNSLLYKGQSLWSPDGRYRLTLQNDGNLVHYGPSGVVWATNIPKTFYLAQQDDGNLVAYDAFGAAIWASHRSGAEVRTFIQNDGNIVSYGTKGAVWASR